MNLTENRLRGALRETAEEVPAGSIPSLEFPPDAGPASRRGRNWWLATRRRRWPAAVAAAAAVCLVVGLSVAVSGGGQTRHPATASPRISLRGVPRYYMALVPIGPSFRITGVLVRSDEAIVRDTMTGKTLATVHVPAPFKFFDAVTGAADDRTFVLSASIADWGVEPCPTKFFLARFNPSTGAVTLTAAPIPEIPKTAEPMAMALSPSGTDLAISDQPHDGNIARVSVYSLATGAVRSWQDDGYIGQEPYDSMAISFSRSGTLAFNYWAYKKSQKKYAGVYLLNTRSAGGSLLAHSRQVVRWSTLPDGFIDAGDAVLTPDGTKIVVAVVRVAVNRKGKGKQPSVTDSYAFDELSAAPGALTRILDTVDTTRLGLELLAWTNSSGSVLVVESSGLLLRAGKGAAFGVLSGRRFTPIPAAPRTYDIVPPAF